MPGNDLLSHGETPHYHRRSSVSLLSSGWDQVGPERYCYQAIRLCFSKGSVYRLIAINTGPLQGSMIRATLTPVEKLNLKSVIEVLNVASV